jgi:penicillin-binding protein 1A
MGIETPLEVNLAMALGASVVTPLEMTSAYGTFANDGVHVDPISIVRVEDKFGNEVASYKPDKREALSASTNYVMVTMLKGVMDRGTAASVRSKYNFRGEAGGKTGTTQNQGDGWFMGFTPQLVAGVWTGFDDNRMHFKSMIIGQGSSSALPVWGMFMKACYDDKSLGLQNRYFGKPGSVYTRMVSRDPNNPNDTSPAKTYPEYFTEASLRRYASLIPGSDSIRIRNSSLVPVANQKKHGEGQY